jgi:group I intron endonuclease
MLYTIYKITNNLNGKIYIGKHQTLDANDSYYGSGKAIVNAIKKHGKENFTKEILFIFQTEEEMNNKEKELITEEFVLREDTYNLGVGGEGGAHFKGKKHTIEVRKKIAEANASRDNSSLKGKIPWNKGHRKNPNSLDMPKIPCKRKRNPLSEATKQKLREKQFERWKRQKETNKF